jgi:hypothetical protein
MRLVATVVLTAVSLAISSSWLASNAHAQTSDDLPSTTDCTFGDNNRCIECYRSALRSRERRHSNEAYTRGWRAFAAVTLTVGAPQLVGGIYAATQAPSHTNLVGYSVGWTINGVFQTLTGTIFAIVPFTRPTSGPDGAAGWIATAIFGLSALGHGAWAAAAWALPPQDVTPAINQVFAASMATNALWYASIAIANRLDLRDQRLRAALTNVAPYASLDPRSASIGLSGRF